MKLSGRQWAGVAGALLMLVLATWALERFLASESGEWSTAIPAVATVVLVGVTSVYVLLTHRLVQAQEAHLAFTQKEAQAARRMAFADEVRKLSEYLKTDARDAVKRFAELFPAPVDAGSDVPPSAFAKLVTGERLDAVRKHLGTVVDHQPAPLRERVYETIFPLTEAHTNLVILRVSVAEAESQVGPAHEGSTTYQPPSWQDVKAAYYVTVRERVGSGPEWAEVVENEAATVAAARIDELAEAVAEYLWSLDSP